MLYPRLDRQTCPLALAVLALLLGTRSLPAQDGQPPAQPPVPAVPETEPAPPKPALPKEVRGVWVVRTDLTSAQSVSRAVKYAKSNRLNTLFVQCRGRGDAFYQSSLEPRALQLAKAPADFDPLAQAVSEGHAAGLQVHAWVNSCYVWSEAKPPASPKHVVNAHRDWLAVDRTGRRLAVGDKEVFICPGNPEARAHLANVCREVAQKYEVDGVQLDYIRYANQNLCYCDGCLQRFRDWLRPRISGPRHAALAGKGRLSYVQAFPWGWRQFRREQVTELVRQIREAVKGARPSALLSAAVIPWGVFPGDFTRTEAYNIVGQDWYGWIKSGLVDAVCPMTYQVSLSGFRSWVEGVHHDHPDFPVWFGIGAWLFGPDSAAAKIQAVRRAGAPGWVLFSYTAVTKSGTDDAYLRALRAKVLPAETAARETHHGDTEAPR